MLYVFISCYFHAIIVGLELNVATKMFVSITPSASMPVNGPNIHAHCGVISAPIGQPPNDTTSISVLISADE